MKNTLAALDELFAKLLVNVGSSKLWVTIGGMAVTAALAYVAGGKDAALAAIAANLGLGGVYVGAKTYQNTHGENSAPAVAAPAVADPVPGAAAAPVTDSAPAPVPVTPFDAAAFMDLVMSRVGQTHNEVNESTIYYEAQTIYNHLWDFQDISQKRAAADLLVVLALKAFDSIWHSSFDFELTRPISPLDCTLKDMRQRAIDKGTQYYTAYLQVVSARAIRESLG